MRHIVNVERNRDCESDEGRAQPDIEEFRPALIGGTNSDMIGTIVYGNFSTNLPFAAAFAVIPMAIMGAYLLIARRLGAFEAL